MGFAAALVSKKGRDVSSEIVEMMESASSYSDGYGLASSLGVVTSKNLNSSLLKSTSLIGYRLRKISHLDQIQPNFQFGFASIFEGRLWEKTSPSDLIEASELIRSNSQGDLERLVLENGSFIYLTITDDQILCCRDLVGVTPIYVGESSELVGAASNKKMLYIIGIKDTEPLPPGRIVKINRKGLEFREAGRIHRRPILKVSEEEAVEKLEDLISESVRARSKHISKASLGFSGGIDSYLLAYFLKENRVNVDLVCVGMEDSLDFEVAEKAADSLSLPVRIEVIQPHQLESDLSKVLNSIEEDDPIKTCIALPLYWAAKSSCEHGSQVFFSGCGSDELFGGYLKYVNIYKNSAQMAEDIMFKDIVESYRINFERDFKICSDLGIELRLPFADVNIIKYALSLPIQLKISKDSKDPRKPLLRALAIKKGLDEDIISKQKRALQYSTRVAREINKLAKSRGLTVKDLISKKFQEAKEEWHRR